MTTTIAIDEALLERLWRAQMAHTQDSIGHSLEYLSDDGYDYLSAALLLCDLMTDLYYEKDLSRLDALLNSASAINNEDHYREWEEFEAKYHMPPLETLAGDGICNELYELNCPALPKGA